MLGLLGVATAYVAGGWILKTAYAPEYAAEAPVLVWMAVAAGVGFANKAVAASVTAARRLLPQLPIALTSVALAFLASSFLIPRWGLVGAAWAVLATETTRLICLGGIYLHAVSSAPAVRLPALQPEEMAAAP